MSVSSAEKGPAAVRTVSLLSLQRARSTIEDFALSYLPYLGLSPERDFFKYLDVLVWCEATIYELDEQNELMSRHGLRAPNLRLAGESSIRESLKSLDLLDERVEQELVQADVYWTNERSLTAQMLKLGRYRAPQHEDPSSSPSCNSLALSEVLVTHEAKSFDYRLLFLILHGLCGAQYNQGLLDFLRMDERLVDIGDDLTDYEDDVEANSFNLYRSYVFLYGSEAPLKLAELISDLESKHGALLVQLPEDYQRHYWRRHEAASSEPGSGKWSFPQPILDESAYRSSLRSLTS
ncbi:hypothetical protein CEUSTIGMA_g5073.t1 [Chlamydomonas eustigma]|uniref:Uncharacterized protein n=1 Tax=Chlamydomonas eustigma TaxID=1157962 RepID=A0A250X4E8_9CHLO|nr:hypothetical protein CEUSTIGMA_g5073.t1 [Chlamydomonas eustigma]|eukprot:GAX77630.1 hypothetical protein CEUSTIGMA_g5073.t1 [Chlamydomonas eustigma]